MRRITRNLRGISPVLAVLMMIAVAIAGALVTYAWVMGYIGFTTEKSGQALMIQSIAYDDDTDILTVYVQNVGEGVVELDPDGCLYVNGELMTGVGGSGSVEEKETATLTASYPDLAGKVTVKVTSMLGTFAEKSTYPAEGGGGGGPATPVLDHFTFDTITTQTSGVAFSITITARDQYDATFTSYTGTNDLTYSAGTISPTATGSFAAGVWTGSVTVTGSGTGVTISTEAQSDPTKTGTSNTFNVDAPAPVTVTRSPSSDSDSGWSNEDRAYDDGGGYAESDRRYEWCIYSDYGFNIPSGATISQVRVRLDAWNQNNDDISLEVYDGSWQTYGTITLSGSETTIWRDVTSLSSGGWTRSEVNGIQVRVTHIRDGGGDDDIRLDWIPIEVTYTP